MFFFSGFTIGFRLGASTMSQRYAARIRGRRLVTVTLIRSVPWTIGLCFSLLHFRRSYPGWLYDWLVTSYGPLFIGQIRTWWIPYLFPTEPERVARYQIMFGKARSFLPPRNGMVLYPALLATAATLIVTSHEVRAAISPRSKLPLVGDRKLATRHGAVR